jgi:two-component system sensor histidine kinase MtrB
MAVSARVTEVASERVLPAVVSACSRARVRVGRRIRRLLAMWRRSLQLRVVTATVLLSVAVVAVIGDLLVDRIAGGLIDAKVDAALDQALGGTIEAREAFDSADRSDPAVYTTLTRDLVSRLTVTGERTSAGQTDVLFLPSPQVTDPAAPATQPSSFSVSAASIPDDLRAQVLSERDRQGWTFVELRGSSGPVPGLAVGSQVAIPDFGPYELYFLFALEKERENLELVRRALLAAGIALIFLVGGVAWIVTRQVVTPVRMAARVSERLAAGRLEERMGVRGEDDLARLAASFNRMATNLQRQIRQLEDLSRVQRRFVSDVSHELRTPLTTVRMAADVLHEARKDFDPATARSAELLQTQLDRFESLLSDLLEISRFDAGAAVLDAEGTDLRDVAARVIEAAEPLAEAKSTVVTMHAPPAPCVAEVDARRIDRILRNLVVNAIEHSEGRPVEVHVDCDATAVAVAVRDHGVGLKPGESALVFNRFWRADPARARSTGGTGLGLSIALEDAHLHGGWLQAWGAPGDGAQFRLTLPRKQDVELHGSPLPLEPPDSSYDGGGRPPAVGRPYRRSIPTAGARGG